MTQNFRQIVQNDTILQRLLSLADNHSLDENDLISNGDFNAICAKVTTINTTDPKIYTRRVAWTLTGRLLLGLTMYHNIRVQICFEESVRLKEQFTHRMFVIEKTKTTKRKTKSTLTQSKNKRKRMLEVEEEVSSVQRIRFWEEPLQFDPNESMPSDSNLAPSDQITLREIEQPQIEDVDMAVDKFNTDFGDEEMDTDLDDELDMNDDLDLFHTAHDYSVSNYSKHIVMQRDSFDENMNDIACDIDEQVEMEPVIPMKPVEDQTSVDKATKRPENPIELLTAPFPRSVAVLKQKGRKRKGSVFKDDDTAIASTIMHRRISNVFVDCKDRKSVRLTEDQLLKLKQADIFSVPVMNTTLNRELFTRSAKVKTMETDWTTIQDAFDSGMYDVSNENGSNGSCEVDILRNETSNRPNTRSSSRSTTNLAISRPLLSSTPIKELSLKQSQGSSYMNGAQSLFNLSDISPVLTSNLSIRTPPLNFQDSALPPAIGFENQNDFEVPILPQQTPSEHCIEPQIVYNEPQNDENDSPSIDCSDLATILGADSLLHAIMKKLLKLWQKNIHPIKIENLLAPRCNRFLAAKTFNSLLILKKKGLVQLENSDDGRIVHIPKGDKLNTIV